MTDQLISGPGGKLWGTAKAILGRVAQAAKVTAQRLRDWVRRGLVHAVKVGRSNMYNLDEVLQAELSTRQTTTRRGGTKRGTSKSRPALA